MTTNKSDEPTLEQRVENLLTSMNRHDRRVWCARLMRRAGRTRAKVLQAKMPKEKAERKALENGTP